MTTAVNANVIDDSSGVILYLGNWTHFTMFDASSGSTKTLSYTEEPGAELNFGFGPTFTEGSGAIQMVVYGYINSTLLPSTASYVVDGAEPVLFTPNPQVIGSTPFFQSAPVNASMPHEMRVFVEAAKANASAPFIVDAFAMFPAGTVPEASPPPGAAHNGGRGGSDTHIGPIVGAAMGGVVFTLLCLLGYWVWRRRRVGGRPIFKSARHIPPTAAMRDTGSSSVMGHYRNMDEEIIPYNLKHPQDDVAPSRSQHTSTTPSFVVPPTPITPMANTSADVLPLGADPFATPVLGATPMSSNDMLNFSRPASLRLQRNSEKLSAASGVFTRNENASATPHPLRESLQAANESEDVASVASSKSDAPPAYVSEEQ
ncbi:hypothetical protein EIP91_010417 [Steccherinum ochraceum]|uniref:Uncharacterized protein n=1 Tax=Steccherinum ochraceum TaxID=92696 RepID=A0A4R0R2V0_9APHY|nr:hypothetical protein EIP91_010417 [Steccherinum ochraceum]